MSETTTSTKPDSSTPTVINAWDQRRIRNAMNGMPFAASSRVPIPHYSPVSGKSAPVTVDPPESAWCDACDPVATPRHFAAEHYSSNSAAS